MESKAKRKRYMKALKHAIKYEPGDIPPEQLEIDTKAFKKAVKREDWAEVNILLDQKHCENAFFFDERGGSCIHIYQFT